MGKLLDIAKSVTVHSNELNEKNESSSLVGNNTFPVSNGLYEPAIDMSSVGFVNPMKENKSSWSPEIKFLIDWFLTLVPPPEPFYLADHIKVIDPIKFFEKLRSEIEAGPTGPRARLGTLQSDLRALQVKFGNKI